MFRSLRFRLPALFFAGILLAGLVSTAIALRLFQNYVSNPSALMFAAVAANRTKRLRILPGVVVLPVHNPLVTASEMAMLDHLAPGRTGIGVARGGARYALDRLGVDPREARDIYVSFQASRTV